MFFAATILALLAVSTASAVSRVPVFSAQKVLCLTNHQRALHHLPPLTLHVKLSHAATAHSHDQARHTHMTHAGSDGSTPSIRISRAGYRWVSSGENVAYGYADVVRLMKAWMASPGHRANILSPKFKSMGAGMGLHGATPFYTQNFGAGGSPGQKVDCSRYGITTYENAKVSGSGRGGLWKNRGAAGRARRKLKLIRQRVWGVKNKNRRVGGHWYVHRYTKRVSRKRSDNGEDDDGDDGTDNESDDDE